MINKHRFSIALSVVIMGIGLLFFANQSRQQQQPAEQVNKTQHHAPSGVVSVDVKVVNDTVHLLLGRIDHGQASVWYQASLDQGQTWSPLVNTTKDLAITAKFHRGNDARLAVQGNHLVAVWMSRKEGAPHNAGSMTSIRSADGGKTWQQATTPADWDGPHGFFAIDGNDHQINLVWLDSREQVEKGSQGLRYTSSQDGGVTWLENKTLDPQTCACCWNTARFNDDGEFYVLYRDKHPSDMAIGKVNQQHQWQRLNTVGEFNWDFQGCPHIGGSLGFDNNNYIHATVSTGHDDYAGVYYLNSSNQGQSWSLPTQLGDDSAVHSDLAVNQQGHITATWDHITETGFQISYAQSTDQGITWSEIKPLSAADKRSSHPRVVALNDHALVIWTEKELDNSHSISMKLIANESTVDE